MKNSFCYLSAHGFLRASQGQTPGGWRGCTGLTIGRGFLLPPRPPLWPVAAALAIRLSGRCLRAPGLSPTFTLVSPSSHAVAVCDVSPGSLFGLPPSPLSPPSPPPPKPRSFVPAHPPVLPAPPSVSFFLTCLSDYLFPFPF